MNQSLTIDRIEIRRMKSRKSIRFVQSKPISNLHLPDLFGIRTPYGTLCWKNVWMKFYYNLALMKFVYFFAVWVALLPLWYVNGFHCYVHTLNCLPWMVFNLHALSAFYIAFYSYMWFIAKRLCFYYSVIWTGAITLSCVWMGSLSACFVCINKWFCSLAKETPKNVSAELKP